MKSDFFVEIAQIYKSYLIKRLEILNFRIHNAQTQSLILNLDVEEIINSLSNKISFSFAEFKKIEEELQNQNRTYNKINDELVYKLHFQAFEEYLSEIIYCCLQNFPNFINSVDIKNEVPYEKIFNNDSNIEDIRNYIISNKVKKIIQSNNIVEIIVKIERLFNFKFNIEKSELDKIYLSSLYRNVLTHNNGIINDIFFTQLKLRNLKSDFSKGDNILNNIKSIIDEDRSIQDSIAEIILEKVLADEKRLKKHHDSLF